MYRLIIVDDEPKIAEGMAQLFPWNNIGFTVMKTFTSAKDALAWLQNETTDVVLSDIQMPDMNGLEFSRRLMEIGGIKVVLFSSYQHYEYFRSAIQEGVADYLLKPLTYTDLTESFTRLKQRLDTERNEPPQPNGYYENLITLIDDYIVTHLQDATLVRCAKRVGLSPSYLSKVYKDHSGHSFSDRLTEVRMEKACEMLCMPDCRTYDVAYDVGYDNPKNFSRAFKAYMGVSPTEYRQEKEDKSDDHSKKTVSPARP